MKQIAYAEWKGMTSANVTALECGTGWMTPVIQFPQLGGFGIFAPFTNFNGTGTVPVGSLNGITAFGSYDMPGNVREWCWNETKAGRVIRGGSYEDNTYEFELNGRLLLLTDRQGTVSDWLTILIQQVCHRKSLV